MYYILNGPLDYTFKESINVPRINMSFNASY